MAELTLTRYKGDKIDPLPPLCLLCGAPATRMCKHYITNRPMIGIPTNPRYTVFPIRVPICDKHPYFGMAYLVCWVGLGLFLGLIGLGFLFRNANGILPFALSYPAGVIFGGSQLFYMYVGWMLLPVRNLTPNRFTIAGVNAAFVDAFEERHWTPSQLKEALRKNRKARGEPATLVFLHPGFVVPMGFLVIIVVSSLAGWVTDRVRHPRANPPRVNVAPILFANGNPPKINPPEVKPPEVKPPEPKQPEPKPPEAKPPQRPTGPVSAVTDPPTARIYLSDLEEMDVRPLPFSWHFGKNGVLGDGAGRFKVKGGECDKGLSAYPEKDDYAGATYRIPEAEVFQSLMGLADNAGHHTGGPIVFEVLGDDRVLWRSEGVRQPGTYQDCRVSVKGVKKLELRAYAPADGNMQDCHVVWIDPYVTRPGQGTGVDKLTPPTPLARAGDQVYLSDMKEYGVKNGPWPFAKGGQLGDPGKRKIVVNGQIAGRGLSMHPPGAGSFAAVRYRLDGKATLLEAAVAINETGKGPFCDVFFEVRGDGRLLWRSLPTKSKTPIRCRADLAGVRELELRTLGRGGVVHECHAVWVDPCIWCSSARDLPKVDN